MNDDKRHVIVVFLVREGRPKYWEFHCPYCAAKVCELDGAVVHMRDLSNDASKAPPVLMQCHGNNKKWCRFWFAFQLS